MLYVQVVWIVFKKFISFTREIFKIVDPFGLVGMGGSILRNLDFFTPEKLTLKTVTTLRR